MRTITYRTYANNWTYGQPGYVPPVEHAVIGRIIGKPDAIGRVDIAVRGSKERLNVHWTAIKRFHPYANGRDFF